MLKKMAAVLVLMGTWAAFYGVAMGTPYSDANLGYSLELPDDWGRIPQDEVEALQQRGTAGHVATFTYVAAFESKNDFFHFQYPYVIAQVTPYPGGAIQTVSESELKKIAEGFSGLSKPDIDKKLSTEASGLFSNWQPGTAVYFTDPPGIQFNFESDVLGIGKVRGVMRGLLAREHMISITLYATEEQWDAASSIFGKMIDHFHLQPDEQVEMAMSSLMRATIWGGVGGGLVGLMRYLKRKRGQAPTPLA